MNEPEIIAAIQPYAAAAAAAVKTRTDTPAVSAEGGLACFVVTLRTNPLILSLTLLLSPHFGPSYNHHTVQ